jgi:hypothetical protein
MALRRAAWTIDAHVGVGYTMNRMQLSLVGTPTALAMIRVFFEAL